MTKKEFINYTKEIRELYDKANELTNIFFSSLKEEKLNKIFKGPGTQNDFCSFEEILNEYLCYGQGDFSFGFDEEDLWKVYQGVNPYDLFYSKHEDDVL